MNSNRAQDVEDASHQYLATAQTSDSQLESRHITVDQKDSCHVKANGAANLAYVICLLSKFTANSANVQ